MITFQYDLEEITFKNKMECKYIRNPFSNQHVNSTSEDVVHHVFVRDKYFASVGTAAKRLPHGCGILKTSSGKVLYSGEWCKGKWLQNERSVIVLMFLIFLQTPRAVSNNCRRKLCDCDCCAYSSDWLKNRASFSTNEKQNPNQSQSHLVSAIFPGL